MFHLLSWPETSADSYKLVEDSVVPELAHIKLCLVQESVSAAAPADKRRDKAIKYKAFREKKHRQGEAGAAGPGQTQK